MKRKRYIAIVGDHDIGNLFNGVLVTAEDQTPQKRFDKFVQRRMDETEGGVQGYYSFFEIKAALGEVIVNKVGEASTIPPPQESSESYYGGYGEGALGIIELFKVT